MKFIEFVGFIEFIEGRLKVKGKRTKVKRTWCRGLGSRKARKLES